MDLYSIIDTLKNLEESTMAGAEKHATGPEFTGYWKGTDKATPGTKMVGGSCEESVEECNQPMTLADKLRARWEETKAQKGLTEYGMTTGGTINPQQANTATANPVDAQKTAQQVNQAQQNLNKLKAAGVSLPTSVGQAAKSAVTTADNPGAATGQGMDSNAKKTAMGLGQEMEKLMTTGDQSQVQQVANAIKQAKMST
jgi:hypothetical protein